MRVSSRAQSLCIHKRSHISIVVVRIRVRNAAQTRRSRFVVIKYNKSSPLRIVPQRIFYTADLT